MEGIIQKGIIREKGKKNSTTLQGTRSVRRVERNVEVNWPKKEQKELEIISYGGLTNRFVERC